MKRLFFIPIFLALSACTSNKSYPLGSSYYPHAKPAILSVSWAASTGNPTGYNVQVSTDRGASYSAVTSTTGLTATILATTGQTYFVRVQAYNPGGTSSYSTGVVTIPY